MPEDIRKPYEEDQTRRVKRKIFSAGEPRIENLVLLGAEALQKGVSLEDYGGRDNVYQIFRNLIMNMDQDQRKNARVRTEMHAAAIALFGNASTEATKVQKLLDEVALP